MRASSSSSAPTPLAVLRQSRVCIWYTAKPGLQQRRQQSTHRRAAGRSALVALLSDERPSIQGHAAEPAQPVQSPGEQDSNCIVRRCVGRPRPANSRPRATSRAAAALWGLASNENNKRLIGMHPDAVPGLVSLLNPEKKRGVREKPSVRSGCSRATLISQLIAQERNCIEWLVRLMPEHANAAGTSYPSGGGPPQDSDSLRERCWGHSCHAPAPRNSSTLTIILRGHQRIQTLSRPFFWKNLYVTF